MMRGISLVIIMSGLWGFSWAQTSDKSKQLAVNEDAELLTTQVIADTERNYDLNGNLSGGILIVSKLSGLTYESSFGILKTEDHSEGDLIYLSPNERTLNVFNDGYERLKISFSDIGLDLKSGQVWKVLIAEKASDIKTGVLIITEELSVSENEIIADLDENKDAKGMLAAGIKIYTDVEELIFKPVDKLLRVQEEADHKMIYITTNIGILEISAEGRDPVQMDLSDFLLESGKIYSLKIK